MGIIISITRENISKKNKLEKYLNLSIFNNNFIK